MRRSKAYIILAKSITATLLIVFSLAPCMVKASLFAVVINAEYKSPLNKAKTTINTASGCSYFSDNYIQTICSEKTDVKQIEPVFHHSFQLSSHTSQNKYSNAQSQRISVNSPPIYILFRQLKLHINLV